MSGMNSGRVESAIDRLSKKMRLDQDKSESRSPNEKRFEYSENRAASAGRSRERSRCITVEIIEAETVTSVVVEAIRDASVDVLIICTGFIEKNLR